MACAVCGEPVLAADTAAVMRHLPASARLPLHERCFEAYMRDSRERQLAWSRSFRGRVTLAWLQVRIWAGVAAVVVTSLVLAPPVALWLVVRGWRLRRAVRLSLGDLHAMVVIGVGRDSPSAALMHDQFTADWAAAHAVSLSFVDSARHGRPASMSDAVWRHWRPNAKVPGTSGVVLVRRAGGVIRFSPPSVDGTQRIGSELRASVEAALLRP